MNRKRLYKSLEDLNALLSEESIPLIYKAVRLFVPIVNELTSNPKDLLVEGGSGQQKRRQVNNQIDQIIQQEKSIKFRDLIIESSGLEDGLKSTQSFMQKENSYSSEFLGDVEQNLESFLAYYEKHTRSYSVHSCLSLSIAASKLYSSLQSTRGILEGVIAYDSSKEELVKNDFVSLDLYLSNVNTLSAFAQKLDALSEIYSELIKLYGVSEDDFPIVIERLENGSLWIKIAGHTLTATLLTSVLTTATLHYQEQFTVTGQLNQLPTSVKVADDLLKLSKSLEESGIDTSEIKENVESATRKISKKLDILLGDQPSVEINDIEHNVGDLMVNRFLEEASNPRLEHNEGS
jgi:hypothetical protein